MITGRLKGYSCAAFPFSFVCACMLSCNGLSLGPWTVAHQDFPGKNTGVGCHFLPQEILPTQGSNLCLQQLLHWQADILPPGPPPLPPPTPFSFTSLQKPLNKSQPSSWAPHYVQFWPHVYSAPKCRQITIELQILAKYTWPASLLWGKPMLASDTFYLLSLLFNLKSGLCDHTITGES